ncbi:MAG: DUF378 domain-containing protein [Gammaproteobacteria bacterium]
MKDLSMQALVAFIIVLAGGINWGLVGLANFNIVHLIFGASFLARILYILVGVSAGYLIYLWYNKKL